MSAPSHANFFLTAAAHRPSLIHHTLYMAAHSDTYFGGYAADAKAGAGLYVFAGGAAYLGSYRDGKREGRGVMMLPDGGTYEGEWVADRFEGQVGGCFSL